jgi:hypothetical protein
MSSGGSNSSESFWEKALDIVKPQSSRPTAASQPPQPPPVDQSAWNQSVEQTQVIPGLTVHQVGLSVFGETQSLTDLPSSNESIDTAREKVAHMIMNGADLPNPPSVHPPVEPSAEALNNPDVKAAYDSSMQAAREAFLSGQNPTNGATHMNMPTTAARANLTFPNGNAQGVPISTQSGPYKNAYPNQKVPSTTAWVNTYMPK